MPHGYDGGLPQLPAERQGSLTPDNWQLHTSGKVMTVKIKRNPAHVGFKPCAVAAACRALAELGGLPAAAPRRRRVLSAIPRLAEEKTALARLS